MVSVGNSARRWTMRIAIVGAGRPVSRSPGSCMSTASRPASTSGIPSARPLSGRHSRPAPRVGQYALEAAGLAEQFHALARSEGEEHKIISPSGDLLVHHVPDAPGARPEIDRTDLRNLLAGSLPAATIHWDARVVAVEEGAGSGFRLGLADGTTSECDLLVGADGGGSLLRSRLTDPRRPTSARTPR